MSASNPLGPLAKDEGNLAAGALSTAGPAGDQHITPSVKHQSDCVIEKCASGLAVLDLNGQIRTANPAFRDLMGHGHADPSATGISLHEILEPESAPEYQHLVAALARGEEDSCHQCYRFVRRDGVVLWIDLDVNLQRDGQGVPDYLVVTAVDITEQRRAEETFRDMSLRDPLTKLPNRRLLQDRLNNALARAKRNRGNLGLLFLDLDGFKPINDKLGHETGDFLLKAVAQRLVDCLRASDTAARLGGDEFVVLLPDLAEREAIHRVAERIRAAVSTPFVSEAGQPLNVSVSIGISLYPDHANTVEALLHAGDEAMYAAKRGGRNRIITSDRTPSPMVEEEAGEERPNGLIHLAWDAGMASGNAFIDAEHRDLIRRANQLLDLFTRADADRTKMTFKLSQLLHTVGGHFEHEERILAKLGYPGLAAHAESHRQLLDKVNDLCRPSDGRTPGLADILDIVVARVIHGHIINEDRDYFAIFGRSP